MLLGLAKVEHERLPRNVRIVAFGQLFGLRDEIVEFLGGFLGHGRQGKAFDRFAQMGLLLSGFRLLEVRLGKHFDRLCKLGLKVAHRFFGIKLLIDVVKGIVCLVYELLQLGFGGVGHKRVIGNVASRSLKIIGRVGITERANRDRPVASAVGVGRQLAASRLREAQLDARGFMHPVVGRELRAEGGKRVGARGIVAVISPGDGLHVRAQVAIVFREIDAQELAVRARSVFHHGTHRRKVGSFLSLALNAGAVASRSSREREVSIFAHGHGLKAVGGCVDVSGAAVCN